MAPGRLANADNGGPPVSSILFLHSSDESFGSDRVLLALVELALAEGMMPRVLLPDDTAPGWLSAQLQQRGVPITKAPLAPARRRYLHARRLPRYAMDLLRARHVVRREARACGADLVYANTSAMLVAAVAGRPGGCRLIWHLHELVVEPRALASVFRALPAWSADEVVAISDAVARNIQSVRPRRARVRRIYNGVADRPRSDLAKSEDPCLCVFAGRISMRKGYDLFLEAAAEVSDEFPRARFVIAGVPSPGEEWRTGALRRRVTELGMDTRTQLPGLCEDVPKLLDLAAVAVVPSVQPEGLGLSTLEAMRSGCAVIASDHGGSREIITNGANGLLVKPGDRGELADALRRVLSDPTLRESLGEAARRDVAEAFSELAFHRAIRVLWSDALGCAG